MTTSEATAEPILRMEGITRRFPGVVAVDGVDFDLRAGEVHVLLGENGAGKSTLIRILSGAERPDEGAIHLFGREEHINSPTHAQRLGISTIYQEFNLIPYLSVAENIYLGRYPRLRGVPGLVDPRALYARAAELLERLGIDVPVRARVDTLSVAQQQMVEIAKALSISARIIVMDEPTATLTSTEVDRLFETTVRLRDRGLAFIFVTHRLQEAKRIGDRATVLRGGRRIDTVEVKSRSVSELIGMMVGRQLSELFHRVATPAGDELLRVEGLGRHGWFQDVSLDVRAGEVVGLAGLIGSGRTSIARAIIGADPFDSGQILLHGRRVIPRSPHDMLKAGLALLPEDRKSQGLVLTLDVEENIALASLARITRAGVVDFHKRAELAARYIAELSIKTPSQKVPVRQLSGGNQQKVVLSKYLARAPAVLVFDEPTRGVDVGAKAEIYELMNRLTAEGHGILMISSELPELLGMSDRVVVLSRGQVTGRFAHADASEAAVLHAMFEHVQEAA